MFDLIDPCVALPPTRSSLSSTGETTNQTQATVATEELFVRCSHYHIYSRIIEVNTSNQRQYELRELFDAIIDRAEA